MLACGKSYKWKKEKQSAIVHLLERYELRNCFRAEDYEKILYTGRLSRNLQKFKFRTFEVFMEEIIILIYGYFHYKLYLKTFS